MFVLFGINPPTNTKHLGKPTNMPVFLASMPIKVYFLHYSNSKWDDHICFYHLNERNAMVKSLYALWVMTKCQNWLSLFLMKNQHSCFLDNFGCQYMPPCFFYKACVLKNIFIIKIDLSLWSPSLYQPCLHQCLHFQPRNITPLDLKLNSCFKVTNPAFDLH